MDAGELRKIGETQLTFVTGTFWGMLREEEERSETEKKMRKSSARRTGP